MNTNRKRIASGAVSVALVGGIVAAALTLGPAMAATPAPTSTYVVPAGPTDLELEAEQEALRAEAQRVEAERVAAEAAAAEAARVEAERVAAEQAAAEQAQRQAPAAPAPQQPAAPAPAPAEPAQPGGDQQAGECREYNDANECTAYYAP